MTPAVAISALLFACGACAQCLSDVQADLRISLICGIEVLIEDAAGQEVARPTIDPDFVSLNPNRAPLSFATTL